MIKGIGDQIFWSIISLLVITLLWLKFIEPFIPLWGSLIVSGIVVSAIFTFNRKKKK
jgi:predicted small integral membrane protein